MHEIEPALPCCWPRVPSGCGATLGELACLDLEPSWWKAACSWQSCGSTLGPFWFSAGLLPQSDPPGVPNWEPLSLAPPFVFSGFINGTRQNRSSFLSCLFCFPPCPVAVCLWLTYLYNISQTGSLSSISAFTFLPTWTVRISSQQALLSPLLLSQSNLVARVVFPKYEGDTFILAWIFHSRHMAINTMCL